MPDSKDEQSWQQIYQHLDWLGLDWCRVEIEHRLFEPEKNSFTFNSKEMFTFLGVDSINTLRQSLETGTVVQRTIIANIIVQTGST